MNKEAKRWLRQLEADLKAAENSLKSKNFEWLCFQSQQSAEKSLKAYLYSLGRTSITTHSIKRLLSQATTIEHSFSDLEEQARILDGYYIPTRYPNGLDEEIAPVDYYDKKDAEKCLKCATLILNAVKKFLKK